MPQCIFCDANLSQTDIDWGYQCCETCYENRGGEGSCHRNCSVTDCRFNASGRLEDALNNTEDAIGW